MPASWVAPTAVLAGNIMSASEDAYRVDDLQFLYNHRHDVLSVDRTQTTLASSGTKTTVFTYPVPAGMLSSNGILRFVCEGRVRCTSGNTNSCSLDALYGGSTFGLVVTGPHAYNDYAIFTFEGVLIANAATNSQVGHTKAWGGHVTGGWIEEQSVATALAIDSTAAQNLTLTFQNSRNNADADWTYFYAAVFGLP